MPRGIAAGYQLFAIVASFAFKAHRVAQRPQPAPVSILNVNSHRLASFLLQLLGGLVHNVLRDFAATEFDVNDTHEKIDEMIEMYSRWT